MSTFETSQRIIWRSMLLAQGIMALVMISAPAVVAPGQEPPGLLAWGFLLAALAMAVTAVLAWRYASGESATLNRLLRESGPRAVRRRTFHAIAWALDEAITVLGLVLVFLGGSLTTGLAFAAAGILLTLLHRPAAPAAGAGGGSGNGE